jgi:hypothetical protein
VDDTFVVIHEYEVDDFTRHINNMDPHIKFTVERDSDGHLPFLDTLVCLQDDGSLKTKIYRNKTHTDQYLQFQSNHHLSHKRSVVQTLMHRAETIVTDPEDKQLEIKHVKEVLQDNGYKRWMFKTPKCKKNANQHQAQKTIKQVDIPYVQGLSENLQTIFKKRRIGIIHKPFNTIRSIIVKPKDKTPQLDMCGAVYEITCPTCKETYVGETARTVKTRLKEHTRHAGPLTAIGEHCLNTGHQITESNIKVIGREDYLWKRKIKEAIEIMQKQPTLNRDTGYYLPPMYKKLLQTPHCSNRGSCGKGPTAEC